MDASSASTWLSAVATAPISWHGLGSTMRMRVSSLLAALLVVTMARCVVQSDPDTADVAADVKAGETTFRMAEPNDAAILVPVMIGEEGPFDFVLDTGATLTCVAESLATELSLPEPRGVIGRGATLGGSGNMRLVRIESLRIGETEATDVLACAIDLSHIRTVGLDAGGLLGLNVLENFRVTLDFERKVLRLEPRM